MKLLGPVLGVSMLLCACGGAKRNLTQDMVYALYNKVALGMSRDAIETALGVKGDVVETYDEYIKIQYADSANIQTIGIVYVDDKATLKMFYVDTGIAQLARGTFSKDAARKIRSGMTMEQVTDVLKVPGWRHGEGNLFGMTMDSYVWFNKQGDRLYVNFNQSGFVETCSISKFYD